MALVGSRPPRAQSAKVGWVVLRARGLLACLQAALGATLPSGDRLQGRGAASRRASWVPSARSQVIIVIYLSVVGALLLYMAFLMLVDPLIRKPDAYTERLHNEEENEVAAPPPTRGVPGASTGGLPLPRRSSGSSPVRCPTVTRTAVSPQRGQP